MHVFHKRRGKDCSVSVFERVCGCSHACVYVCAYVYVMRVCVRARLRARVCVHAQVSMCVYMCTYMCLILWKLRRKRYVLKMIYNGGEIPRKKDITSHTFVYMSIMTEKTLKTDVIAWKTWCRSSGRHRLQIGSFTEDVDLAFRRRLP